MKEALTTSILEGWGSETSIGWSVKCTDAVLGSLVVDMMALKSFVLGLTMPCSGQVSVFAGLICNVVSCVCSASIECWTAKDSWFGVVEDAGLSVDVSWALAAGFVSGLSSAGILLSEGSVTCLSTMSAPTEASFWNKVPPGFWSDVASFSSWTVA